jgi:pyridoxal 5'-phosphate synthase pdxS subunit
MQLGVDGVFVGSGIFKSGNPEKRAKAMVQAVTHYSDFKLLGEVSEDLGEPMVILACNDMLYYSNCYSRCLKEIAKCL